jgi:hypothetical protein
MRKITSNKRILMIACSLAAIPLTIALMTAASDRARRRNLLKSRETSVQTRSKMSVITSTDSHIQKEISKEQQPQSHLQGSETTAATMTTTATISTSTTAADKEDVITVPGVVPSPFVPSSSSDSSEIIISSSSSSSQTSREEEISVSDEAGKTGESLKELIVTAIKEAKDSAKETGKRLKQQPINIATTADSKEDIHSLKESVNSLVTLFEEMMIEIRKQRYNEQIKLLDSYKDLLRTHIKIIDARGRMARKLKPGA